MIVPERLVALIPQRHKNSIKRGIAFGRRLIVQPRLTPTFMVIGAQKAGTSSLFKYLIAHGNYMRPLLKDVYFFDRDFHRGLAWYLTFFPTQAAAHERAGKVGGPAVTGELATHYLLHPWSPVRLRETFPDIRLVVLLRDPVQRAISHFYHNVRAGVETAASPFDAFQMEEERIGADARRMAEDPAFYSAPFATYSYLARGRYADQLERWLKVFPREQMLVQCSERFFAESDASFREICRFIGIPEKSLASYPRVGQGRNRREDERGAAFARDHFRSHNVRLRALLNDDYGWPQ